MANNNPFNSNEYDLGVGNQYGYDMQGATENLLYQPANQQPCYVCGNTAQYQILAKKPQYTTAQIQNGLYTCKHCLQIAPIDPQHYGIKELK